jgi:hypothetical protein
VTQASVANSVIGALLQLVTALLFKGNDFGETDLRPAVARSVCSAVLPDGSAQARTVEDLDVS